MKSCMKYCGARMKISVCVKLIAAAAVMVFFSGCAQIKAPAYSPDYAVVDDLKGLDIGQTSVGNFTPRDPGAAVNKIWLRAMRMESPSGTFVQYLEDAIRYDLKEVGVYDPSSTTVINASVLRNEIDLSGLSQGYGRMEVEINVAKQGQVIFSKNYRANTQFESSLIGAVAIPKGQNAYPLLVRELLKKVYMDPEFIAAVRK